MKFRYRWRIKNLIKNEVDENFLVLNPDTIWNDKYLDEVVQMKNLFLKII